MLIATLMGAALILGPACTLETAPTAGDKGGKVPFRTDAEKAISDAQKVGAGMMLYFTSEG